MFNKLFSKEINETIEEEDKMPRKEGERISGKIIKLSDEGWGFISSREKKFTRIFFHWTALTQDTLRFDALKMHMRVSFIPIEIQGKGIRAIKVKVED